MQLYCIIDLRACGCVYDMEVKIKTTKKGKLANPQTLNFCTSENFLLYSIIKLWRVCTR